MLTQLVQGLRSGALSQEGDQVFLPRLPEDHPIGRQRPFEAFQLLHLATERNERDEAFDAGGAVIRVRLDLALLGNVIRESMFDQENAVLTSGEAHK